MTDPAAAPAAAPYVPPHRRRSPEPAWATLDQLNAIRPDDSVSCLAPSPQEELYPLQALTEFETAHLLANLGLGKYADACVATPLRGQDLAHCREEDLLEIGIAFRPHRISLLEEVARMAAQGVPADMLAPVPGLGETGAHFGAPVSPVPAAGDAEAERAAADGASDTPTWLAAAARRLERVEACPSGEATSRGPSTPTARRRPTPPESGRPQPGASRAVGLSSLGRVGAELRRELGREDEAAKRPRRSSEDAALGEAALGEAARLQGLTSAELAIRCQAMGLKARSLDDAVRASRASREASHAHGESAAEPRAVEAAGAPPARTHMSSGASAIAAGLEGLSLRSEAGTAIRAVQRGARLPSRWGAHTQLPAAISAAAPPVPPAGGGAPAPHGNAGAGATAPEPLPEPIALSHAEAMDSL